jgi:hypothetical protein
MHILPHLWVTYLATKAASKFRAPLAFRICPSRAGHHTSRSVTLFAASEGGSIAPIRQQHAGRINFPFAGDSVSLEYAVRYAHDHT